MSLIAGTLDLSTVMTALSARRPVFHSEADFQFAFAQTVAAADPSIEVRLEVRQAPDRAEYVDLVCWSAQQRTLIEFKYATARWVGRDPAGEQFYVRNHAAFDLARRYFIHDLQRLERFVEAEPKTDGVAIILTNEPGLWSDSGSPTARDTNFRIHDGRTFTGHLEWGTGDAPKYNQHLDGTYTTHWEDFSCLDGLKGRFRWLALRVRQSEAVAATTQLPPMTDAHIAAHEAGHALVAHLMGDEIQEVDMYTGPQSAAVRPVHWPPTRATLLAGIAAEMLLQYQVNPLRARKDINNAAPLPIDPDEPSPRTLLAEHRPVLDALRQDLTEARMARKTIPGSDVHDFLASRGCVFGSRQVKR